MAISFDGITIQPSEDTRSKIAAYAVLSRQNIDAVVGQLEGLLNDMLKQKCIELLGGEVAYQAPVQAVKVEAKRRSFADAHKEAAAPPTIESAVEEAFGHVEGNTPQHELSNDEDTQNNKSLEEQVAEDDALDPAEVAEFQRAFAAPKVKNAGNNAEAFLDNVMGDPDEDDGDAMPSVTRGYAGQGHYGERPVKASKSFESRIMKGHRAKISAHTGEED
jgi:hypothetical protein